MKNNNKYYVLVSVHLFSIIIRTLIQTIHILFLGPTATTNFYVFNFISDLSLYSIQDYRNQSTYILHYQYELKIKANKLGKTLPDLYHYLPNQFSAVRFTVLGLNYVYVVL